MFAGASAEASPYYRFWRGERLGALTPTQFVDRLNTVFIPETVAQGRGLGLLAYLPVMMPEPAAAPGLPHEVALVVYESEQAYDAIRKTERGARYQALHGELFERSGSGSRVPAPWTERAEIDQAYDITGSDADWQRGDAVFLLHVSKTPASPSPYADAVLARVRAVRAGVSAKAPVSYVILVGGEGLYEYILYARGQAPACAAHAGPPALRLLLCVPLSAAPGPIGHAKGLNVRFE